VRAASIAFLREISERVWLSIIDTDDVATIAVLAPWLPRRYGVWQVIRCSESDSASGPANRRRKRHLL
jgi:hypothetical protein